MAALVLTAGAHAQARLVTAGYPYASSCPQAGDRDDVDRWKMNTCNCTSYAAWALWRNGYRTDWFVAGSMDAWNWPNVARRAGIPSGSTARVGAVAVWPSWGKLGHIAVVTAVHRDRTFDVAEYNLPGRRPKFGFDRRTSVSPRGVTFVYVPRRFS